MADTEVVHDPDTCTECFLTTLLYGKSRFTADGEHLEPTYSTFAAKAREAREARDENFRHWADAYMEMILDQFADALGGAMENGAKLGFG